MAKKEKKCCGNCFWFDNEDAYGQGWCIDEQCETSCGSICGNHFENNWLLTRRFRIEKILVTPEQRVNLDKRAWVKILTHRFPSGVYHYLIPNVKTEQGRAVSQVLASYNPVAGFNDVRIGLNLTEPVNRPIEPFRLYFFRSRAFFYVDEPSMRFKEKDETLEEIFWQQFHLDFYDELNEMR